MTEREPADRSEALGYVPALDGLRAISIAMVVGYHSPLEKTFLFGQGSAGVDVFFVLSGYLITGLLLDERSETGSVSLRDFYVRRLLRIVPAYLVFVLALALSPTEAPGILPWLLTYTSNIALAWGFMPVQGGAPVTWSLSMEEQFYALWPPLATRFPRRGLLVGVLVAIVAMSAWRLFLVGQGVVGFPRLDCRPDARLDTILWGCLAALFEREGAFRALREGIHRRRRPLLAILLVLGAGSYVMAGLDITYAGRVGYTLQAALTAALILWVRCSPGSRVTSLLGSWPLVWVGRLSYSIYLWHLAAAHFGFHPIVSSLPPGLVASLPGWSRWTLGTLLWIALVVAAGLASYFLIERPFLRLKKRFTRARSEREAGLVRAG